MEEADLIPINEALSLPMAELQFRFTTGGGPGGQHVNKTATRVTLLFDVAGSPSLDEATRARLLDRLATRLDRRGVLHIDVQESRSQWQNRELALARLAETIRIALIPRKKRVATKPSRGSKEERYRVKKKRGEVKRNRGRITE